MFSKKNDDKAILKKHFVPSWFVLMRMRPVPRNLNEFLIDILKVIIQVYIEGYHNYQRENECSAYTIQK
jgi:hypothetical protein